jgi:hypothetical protein
MIKNLMTLIAVISLVSTVSCKKEEGTATFKLDDKNMVQAQDQADQMAVVPKKIMKPEEYSKIEIDNVDFDFGDITQGDKVEHVYKFKNIGKDDLIIIHAQASCGCTVPEWTKTPVKRGESGEIKIIFNSEGKIGHQNKTITLRTNTELGSEILRFKVNINPKAEKNIPAKK